RHREVPWPTSLPPVRPCSSACAAETVHGGSFLLPCGEVDMSEHPQLRGWWSGRPSRWGQWPARARIAPLLVGLLGAPAASGQAVAPMGEVSPGDWPCWRGPGGTGSRAEPLPGPHWSATHGVLWKVAVPGQGHASPIVVGDRVLISTADQAARALLCYQRQTG